MAGAYLVLAQIGLFRESIVSGQGFIALGIVIFGTMESAEGGTGRHGVRRVRCTAAVAADFRDASVPPQLLLALPYIVTILAISGLFGGKAVQPAALMTPYIKGLRSFRHGEFLHQNRPWSATAAS